jgi:DNA-binding MltR family transcriptional regulator
MGRTILPPQQLSQEAADLYKAINEGSPLACVLIAAASLDKALISLLGKYFVNGDTSKRILSENGFLGESSRCTDIAYCLGLISKGFLENLKSIAQIRNKFAHSHLFLDFDDKEIMDKCNKLRFPKIAQAVSVGHEGPDFLTQFGKDPRFRFVMISVIMFEKLIGIGITTEQRTRPTDSWETDS